MGTTSRSLLLCSVLALAAAACQYQEPDPFTEPLALAGGTVDPDTLNRGRENYVLYCYACHGMNGDGAGPASYALRPPPRDFRTYTFKFAGVSEGLPHDEDLKRIVKEGLLGTAMLPWDVPEPVLDDIIQYIKTFSPEDEGWRDSSAELGERVVAAEDPWGDARRDEAMERGKLVYHGFATCWSCHPGYVSEGEIAEAGRKLKGAPIETYRPALYYPEIKETQYTAPVHGAKPCNEDEGVECEGDGETCVQGVCSRPVKVLPPDFLFHEVRSGTTLADLFRTIGAGIPGTAMPAWKGSLPDEDIWAMAYYVRSLVELKGTEAGQALKKRLVAGASAASK